MMDESFRDRDPVEFYQSGKPKLPRVSALMLERYNLGEVTGEERNLIEAALIGDKGLAERLRELRQSDAEIRGKLHWNRGLTRTGETTRRPPVRLLVWSLCAAALVLFIALPFFRILAPGGSREIPGAAGDRIKGNADTAELRVYLKTEGEQAPLVNQAVLREGDTIQLAYTVKDRSDSRYGVIFSIDGRSTVIMHYPYVPDADTRLVTEKRTFLEEAYTLDDAPDYELFFFVIGDRPLDIPEILDSARQLARNPETALDRGPLVFKNYELKTFTLRKE
ncbi:MAG: hypothetical protein LBB78_08805 [Spirochaetaceae bacterium]|jgi:hypothetical protein|nr:hypothetical protein [Spirochaetaceae bacterium]